MLSSLPVDKLRDEIVSALSRGENLVLSAPPGTGKSTRVPRFLLDMNSRGRILVLQPRRIAARFLARRVAQELSILGLDPERVGYITRNDSKYGPSTELLFITSGILPELMAKDPLVRDVRAIVFDEFHERSLGLDLGLGLAVEASARRDNDLSLIVMSATMDTAAVSTWLGGAREIDLKVPVYETSFFYRIPRHGAPVWDMAAKTLSEIFSTGQQGDVLIFMPGAYEIRRTIEACSKISRESADGDSPMLLIPLMGGISSAEEEQIMAPAKGRKIIVATNVAETSLTIPGVRFVIDSGLSRLSRFDPSLGMDILATEPVSRFSADQRAGRASRESSGIVYRLWAQEELRGKAASLSPEVLRCDISQEILKLTALGYDPHTFAWYEKPPEIQLDRAFELLRSLGALKDSRITEEGRLMASFPCHPRLARMILSGAERGVLQEAVTAAVILSEGLGARKTMPSGSGSFSNSRAEESFDLVKRLLQWQGGEEEIRRSLSRFMAMAEKSGFGKGKAPFRERERLIRETILSAYPDRIAALRGPAGVTGAPAAKALEKLNPAANEMGPLEQGRVYELTEGSLGMLEAGSNCCGAPLILFLEAVRTQGGGRAGSAPVQGELRNCVRLSRALEIQVEMLLEVFPHQWEERDYHCWNSGIREVERFRESLCCSVPVERIGLKVDESVASGLLAAQVGGNRLPLTGWNDSVRAWIEKVAWVAALFPEEELVTYDDQVMEIVISEVCQGHYRYSTVRDRACLDLVRNILSWKDQRFVEEMAPEQIILPSGRKMKITYSTDRGAVGRAFIQDLFDLQETPRIAAGRAPLLLEILAPNRRPIQITEDLKGFWKNHYPELKKALSRRYPRHRWI